MQERTRSLQVKLYLAAKQNRRRRFHALYDKLYRNDVLWRAWEMVKANGGSVGVDGVTIEDIERRGVVPFFRQLQEELRNGSYRPQPVRRVYIPKPDGRKRPLGIPTVRDRIVQTAAKIVLEPIFEANFCDCSYGFRPKRSAHDARRRIRQAIQREQCRWVVDADIVGFFDNLKRGLLMRLVRRRINDRRMLRLLWQWLDAGVMEDGMLHQTETGTPQGGVISPLLANIYLHVLDMLWQTRYSRLGKLVRYADDLVILTWQRWQAERIYRILQMLLGRLGLTLSPEKTRVVNLQEKGNGFDFLGYHYRWLPSHWKSGKWYIACWPSQKAMKHARERIRELTPLHRIGLPVSVVVHELNQFLGGWGAYFRYGNSTRQFRAMDNYVVERLSRFISRKYGRRGIRRGMAVYLASHTHLGLRTLVGTVVYDSVNA